jgi:hypothetical protein
MNRCGRDPHFSSVAGDEQSVDYSGPEVLVLYLKRPRAKELGVETLWRGASDTAT